jgi:hypothetical protein
VKSNANGNSLLKKFNHGGRTIYYSIKPNDYTFTYVVLLRSCISAFLIKFVSFTGLFGPIQQKSFRKSVTSKDQTKFVRTYIVIL